MWREGVGIEPTPGLSQARLTSLQPAGVPRPAPLSCGKTAISEQPRQVVACPVRNPVHSSRVFGWVSRQALEGESFLVPRAEEWPACVRCDQAFSKARVIDGEGVGADWGNGTGQGGTQASPGKPPAAEKRETARQRQSCPPAVSPAPGRSRSVRNQSPRMAPRRATSIRTARSSFCLMSRNTQ